MREDPMSVSHLATPPPDSIPQKKKRKHDGDSLSPKKLKKAKSKQATEASGASTSAIAATTAATTATVTTKAKKDGKKKKHGKERDSDFTLHTVQTILSIPPLYTMKPMDGALAMLDGLIMRFVTYSFPTREPDLMLDIDTSRN
jgi:hypothetical protein